MSRQLPGTCRQCKHKFAGNRKYCSDECRELAALEMTDRDPSPEEILEMCRMLREAGGEAWERSHTCYPVQSVQVRTAYVHERYLAGMAD